MSPTLKYSTKTSYCKASEFRSKDKNLLLQEPVIRGFNTKGYTYIHSPSYAKQRTGILQYEGYPFTESVKISAVRQEITDWTYRGSTSTDY